MIPVTVDPQLPHVTAGAVAVAVESGTRDAVRALGYTETNLETADLVFYVHGKSMTPVAITSMDYVPAPAQFGMRADEMEAYAGRAYTSRPTTITPSGRFGWAGLNAPAATSNQNGSRMKSIKSSPRSRVEAPKLKHQPERPSGLCRCIDTDSGRSQSVISVER